MANTAFRRQSAVGRGSSELQFVFFALAGQDYGVEVTDVHGIYHGLPIIPNPDTPHALEGEVQLAGRRVPVVNLRRFAGLDDTSERNAQDWIIMIRGSGGPIGMVVDNVLEVLRLRASAIEQPYPAADTPVANYVRAVVHHDGRTLYLPDFTRLLHDAVH